MDVDPAVIIAFIGALGIGAMINQLLRWALVDRTRNAVSNTETLAGTALGLVRALQERNLHLETEVGKLRGEVAMLRAQLDSHHQRDNPT